MSDDTGTNEDAEGQKIIPGMPIYDVAGDKVGIVSEYGVQEPHLVMQKGHLFHTDVYIPLIDIQRTDATGVYLTLTRKQVHHLLGGWSELGEVDLNTGVPANTDLGAVSNFPDGNNIAGTTTDTSGQPGLPRRDESAQP